MASVAGMVEEEKWGDVKLLVRLIMLSRGDVRYLLCTLMRGGERKGRRGN